ncbi:MAG: GNAT family N-acetyltransferase [Candidatus Cloacimonetes bacterium]|nr:GNAT family N-acetyltransferase [Candidatus Cloacimonadota bacterium]
MVSNSFCFVIAKRKEEIIGMGRAISDGFSDAYIQDVTVWENERGKGIGKGIIKELIRFLEAHEIQWIGLISEPGYEDFYSKLGFGQMKSYTPFLYKKE